MGKSWLRPIKPLMHSTGMGHLCGTMDEPLYPFPIQVLWAKPWLRPIKPLMYLAIMVHNHGTQSGVYVVRRGTHPEQCIAWIQRGHHE